MAVLSVMVATLVVLISTGDSTALSSVPGASVQIASLRVGVFFATLLTPLGVALQVTVWTVAVVLASEQLGIHVDAWGVLDAVAVAEAIRVILPAILTAALGASPAPHRFLQSPAGSWLTPAFTAFGSLPLLLWAGCCTLLMTRFARIRIRASLLLGLILIMARGGATLVWLTATRNAPQP